MLDVGGSSSSSQVTSQVDATRPTPPDPATRSPPTKPTAGMWSYFNAGANATAGRDPNVGPLDDRNQ